MDFLEETQLIVLHPVTYLCFNLYRDHVHELRLDFLLNLLVYLGLNLLLELPPDLLPYLLHDAIPLHFEFDGFVFQLGL